ncbi:hypothetical protein [Flavobacterium sp.]|jgi:hypothetical protein|uniref:hypothetical protein n=1 Tax=Flavobacterium sp. TaxID=239 RepID=UPI000ECD377C|nr:hypothetical protein [Flavobacterium sp.]HCQ14352.1 hypothetical protein [Flavobacterium sp.]
MKEVYVVLLADSNGNFEWVYTHPKPYYLSKEEAQKVREELIEKEETVTEQNSKVVELYKME